MGLFQRLNARLIAAIERRSGTAAVRRVTVDAARAVVDLSDGSRHEWAWADLTQAVAIRRVGPGGDEVSLLLQWRGPRVVEIPASCDGWAGLCAALEALPGAVPFGQWHVQALLASAGEAVSVWAGAAAE